MSSLEIAGLTGKQHSHVLRDIEKMFADCGEAASKFGSGYKDKNGQKRPCYHLDFDWTVTLISGYNVKLRRAIVLRWQELEKKEKERQSAAISRKEAATLCIDLNNSIHEQNIEKGKEDKFYHFSNAADLINRIVLGRSAAQFRKDKGISPNEPLRDHLPKEVLDAISHLQRVMSGLIDTGTEFQDCKAKIEDVYRRRWKDKILATVMNSDRLL